MEEKQIIVDVDVSVRAGDYTPTLTTEYVHYRLPLHFTDVDVERLIGEAAGELPARLYGALSRSPIRHARNEATDEEAA